MKEPRISILVINWNGKHYLKECYDTILNQSYSNYEIGLVDQASTDGSVEYTKENYKKVRVFDLKENYGFSKGYNIVLDKILKEKFDYVLIMNNDVKLEKDMLKHLIEATKRHPDGVIFGPKIYFYDVPNMIWSAGVKLRKLTTKASLIGLQEIDNGQFDEEKEVDQIVGAALLVRADKIGNIRFNEGYWAYYEETEFEYKILKSSGMKSYYVPRAVMWHKVAGSSGGGASPHSIYYIVRNRGYFIMEHAKGFRKVTSILSWFAEVGVRCLMYAVTLKFKRLDATAAGAWDFIRNKKGTRKK